MDKRQGFILCGLMMFVMLMLLACTATYFSEATFEIIRHRTALIQRVVNEMTEFINRQSALYSVRRGIFYSTHSEAEKDLAKSAALSAWFSRSEIEAEKTFSYEELRERFGETKFEPVDTALNPTTLNIKSFKISIPKQVRKQGYANFYTFDEYGRGTVEGNIEQEFSSAVFDENDFVIACNVVMEIEMNDGYRLAPMSGGRTRDKDGVTAMWRLDGVTVTIPVLTGGKDIESLRIK